MMIRIHKLTKCYKHTTIFTDFNYVFHEDVIYLFNNENGTGKTTFFYTMLDEIKYQGLIIDNHYSITYLPDKVNFPLFISLDNFIKLFNIDIDNNNYLELLDLFDMKEYRNKNVSIFSKGMKQKTLLIRMLLDKSKVLIFDEPLSGLDTISRNNFIKYLTKIKKDKIIMIATHYLSEYLEENHEVKYQVVSLV